MHGVGMPGPQGKKKCQSMVLKGQTVNKAVSEQAKRPNVLAFS